MREFIFRLPDDETSEWLTGIAEKLGGEVHEKQLKPTHSLNGKTKIVKEKLPSPTMLFGKWKDVDLDPKTYRDKLWPQKKL